MLKPALRLLDGGGQEKHLLFRMPQKFQRAIQEEYFTEMISVISGNVSY